MLRVITVLLILATVSIANDANAAESNYAFTELRNAMSAAETLPEQRAVVERMHEALRNGAVPVQQVGTLIYGLSRKPVFNEAVTISFLQQLIATPGTAEATTTAIAGQFRGNALGERASKILAEELRIYQRQQGLSDAAINSLQGALTPGAPQANREYALDILMLRPPAGDKRNGFLTAVANLLDPEMSVGEKRAAIQILADAAATGFQQSQLFTAPRLTFMGKRSPHYPYEIKHYYYSPTDFRDQLALTLHQERTRVTQAMRTLARFITHLQDSRIDWEYEYSKEDSKRWRARYDLTKGRLLATQARFLEYIATSLELEQTISPACNKITLYPGSSFRNPAAQMFADEASRVLYRCKQENAGTPWQDLAQWELDKPFGFRIERGQIPKPPPRIVAGSTGSPPKVSCPKR